MKELKSVGVFHSPVILAFLMLLTFSTLYAPRSALAQSTAFTYQGPYQ